MGDVRRVVFDKAKDLWVYEDNGNAATLADTRASLNDGMADTMARAIELRQRHNEDREQ